MRRWLTPFLLIGCLATTAAAQDGIHIARIPYERLAGWGNDRQGEALAAFQRSCTKLLNLPAEASIGIGPLAGSAASWHHACREARLVDPADALAARAYFEREFVPFTLLYHDNPNGKITGYYEPLMRGSWDRKSGYQEPVYGRPDDLPSGAGVYPLTRRDIDGGALANRGLERMYVNDPVDLFFLHVQGSGRVLMDTGEMVALRFDGKNNQPYTAIGKVLVERGALKAEEVSAPAIRRWLRENPAELRDILHHNPSFVFFRVEADAGEGPVGAQNVPLMPERSLAVDTAYIPLGMPVWLDTVLPATRHGQGAPYRRLMVAQDKGSAIIGAIRGDVFFGFGERAEDLAGHMNSEGRFTVLVPQAIARHIDGRIY